MKLSARGIAGAAVAMSAVLLTPTISHAESRATTIAGAPDGETYYLYADGGSGDVSQFPTDHGLALYKETNHAPCTAGSVPEGPPIGHGTEPSGSSNLQVQRVKCGTTWYDPDTIVVYLANPPIVNVP